MSRNQLLKNLGTDFYIMTESHIDYAIDSAGETLVKISDKPQYMLRCYFDNDIVSRIVIIDNKNLCYRSICTILDK